MKSRVFSGIQPTGIMHLGNYLGAIKNWVAMQETSETIFSIVDAHAITVWQEPSKLRESIFSMAACLIACGIDPKKSILFVQSSNPDHFELAWYFNTIARMGWLKRMTQFKEKAGKNQEEVSVGLFGYPVLQAADILCYKADRVPVGDDQMQHLELCRDIANKFNHDYGVNFFPDVKPVLNLGSSRVMSLRDGLKKMSKSDPSEYARIELTDSRDVIAMKIKKAASDNDNMPMEFEGLKDRPNALNLVSIMAGLTNKTNDEIMLEIGGKTWSEFKTLLIDICVLYIEPIGNEINHLLKDGKILSEYLYDGGKKARDISNPIITEVRDIIGFIN